MLYILATRDFLLAAVFLCKRRFFNALSIAPYTTLRSSHVRLSPLAIFLLKMLNEIFKSSLNFLLTTLFLLDWRIAFLAEEVIGINNDIMSNK